MSFLGNLKLATTFKQAFKGNLFGKSSKSATVIRPAAFPKPHDTVHFTNTARKAENPAQTGASTIKRSNPQSPPLSAQTVKVDPASGKLPAPLPPNKPSVLTSRVAKLNHDKTVIAKQMQELKVVHNPQEQARLNEQFALLDHQIELATSQIAAKNPEAAARVANMSLDEFKAALIQREQNAGAKSASTQAKGRLTAAKPSPPPPPNHQPELANLERSRGTIANRMADPDVVKNSVKQQQLQQNLALYDQRIQKAKQNAGITTAPAKQPQSPPEAAPKAHRPAPKISPKLDQQVKLLTDQIQWYQTGLGPAARGSDIADVLSAKREEIMSLIAKGKTANAESLADMDYRDYWARS